MRIAFAGALALVLFTLGACRDGNVDPAEALASQIRGLDAEAALALANEWRTTEPDVGSTLTADAVVFVLPGGSQVSVPLPANEMVLAVAPYVTTTHPCAIHSIDGCTGEMAGVSMWVHAETPDGTVLVDELMAARDNGFIELWLPRDSEIVLTIEAGDLVAQGTVTTHATSNTCIVELRLQ